MVQNTASDVTDQALGHRPNKTGGRSFALIYLNDNNNQVTSLKRLNYVTLRVINTQRNSKIAKTDQHISLLLILLITFQSDCLCIVYTWAANAMCLLPRAHHIIRMHIFGYG